MAFMRALVVAAMTLVTAAWSGAVLAGPLDAVVAVRAEIPTDARTAGVLGTERRGSGIVIDDDGLVVTIGYLILEANQVEIELSDSRVLPAGGVGLRLRYRVRFAAASDQSADRADRSGRFRGASGEVASPGGQRRCRGARDAGLRRIAPGFRRLLGVSAARRDLHHAALSQLWRCRVDRTRDGRLLGIGSLLVGDAIEENNLPGNMFVPIEALKPIMDELLTHGRAQGPTRPWLGIYGAETRRHVYVNRVAPEGPAAAAGLLEDDLIVAVQGRTVGSLDEFYRAVWSLGDAGVEVPLTILRDGALVTLPISSGDRYDYLKLPPESLSLAP